MKVKAHVAFKTNGKNTLKQFPVSPMGKCNHAKKTLRRIEIIWVNFMNEQNIYVNYTFPKLDLSTYHMLESIYLLMMLDCLD